MGDLSTNFSVYEFACRCGCGFEEVSGELIDALEELRSYFDQPVTITSGCRCVDHNRVCGGSDGSKHLDGIAADIIVKDVPPNIVADVAEEMQLGGVGRYSGWTHIDVRDDYVRWGSN
jgi:uncharacterized protein YcbK (DUF882 family)